MPEERLENQEVRLTIRQLSTPLNAPGLRNVVVLGDEFQRELQIGIGPCETLAILEKTDEGEKIPAESRPRAHDLLKVICDALGARVEKVVIDDLWKRTFYAKLYLFMDEESIVIDARPSDAIALALRAEAPIYASEAVMVAVAESQGEEDR